MATDMAVKMSDVDLDDISPVEEVTAVRESVTFEIKSHPGCMAAMQIYGPCDEGWKGWISVGLKNRPGGHVDKESQPTVWQNKYGLINILTKRIADWFSASDLPFGKEVAAEVLESVGEMSENFNLVSPDATDDPATESEIAKPENTPPEPADSVSGELLISDNDPVEPVADISRPCKQLNLGAYEDLTQLEEEIICKRQEGRAAHEDYLEAKESAKDLKKRWECKREELDELCDQLQEVKERINNDLRNPTRHLPFSSPQYVPPISSTADPADGDTVSRDPDAWRSFSVRDLNLTEKLLDRLEEAEFGTIGLLEDARASGALAKTKGIGKGKLTLIEDAVLAWLGEWRTKNPSAEPPADLIDGKWEAVAYKSGSLARADGASIQKNPHPADSLLHSSWDAGWCREGDQLAEEDPENEAYRLGCESATKDEEASNNPHKAGTGLWHAWDRGWQETVAVIDMSDFDDDEEGDDIDTLEDQLDALLEGDEEEDE